MYEPQKYWLQKLRRLHPNVSLAKGPGAARFAPHKPLLLLALIDLADAAGPAGLASHVPLNADLRVRFLGSWAVVVRRWGSKPNLNLPFYHLSSQGFWVPKQANGLSATDPDSTAAIELHPEFVALLALPGFRELARHVLIQTWFPADEQIGLYALYGAMPDPGAIPGGVEEDSTSYAASAGRDARFRIQVVTQYIYTCALTGYTLTTAGGATIVEAAHITDFASSRNNDPRNGLALTPDAHWSFDELLWTVDEKQHVVVADAAFSDWSPEGRSLTQFRNRPLHFNSRALLRPHDEYLAIHRETFRAKWNQK
jgi:putative restriction endonuclease